MKVTEIRIYPKNSPENQVVSMGTVEGDHNVLYTMFHRECNARDKSKQSYIFEFESPECEIGKTYVFNLTPSEMIEAKQFIPLFKIMNP